VDKLFYGLLCDFMDALNKEFIRLMKAVGWSQNETARRLHMTGGGVSQICTGRVRPSKGRLNLLQLLVERENPEAVARLNSELEVWAQDLLHNLRQMHDAQRGPILEAFKQMIRAVSKRRGTYVKRL